jgi:hypothetical protein
MRALRRTTLIVVAILVASCSASTFSPPPDSAGPDVVLRAYLDGLVKGDCSAGRLLGIATFDASNGDLCGHTNVRSYTVLGAPPPPNTTEAVFATTLVTSGTPDGSIQPGSLTWFYQLKRQPSGSWRLAGGGSGP